MSYRFLIITSDYSVFLDWFYSHNPGLEDKPYDEQMRLRRENLFGVTGFYCDNLNKLGHEAREIYLNNEVMQSAWAEENGVKNIWAIRNRRRLRKAGLNFYKAVCLLANHKSWRYNVIRSQVKHYKPDILIIQDINGVDAAFLREIKPQIRMLIGQHAATELLDIMDWGCYDLIISSFSPTVNWFRERGINAELNRLGFEPKVLSFLSSSANNSLDISFIGSFHKVHSSRTKLLERLCSKFQNMKIWGPETPNLPSSIRNCYAGQAWGQDMYQILKDSKIVFNHHGDVLPHANNLRLFETTGVGALLVTDWKEDLKDMFQPGKELITYRDVEECIEAIQHYLARDDERRTVAMAGQQRTLNSHTYYQRMLNFTETVNKFLRKP